MSFNMNNNIEEYSLRDLVEKGILNNVIKELEISPVSLDDESYTDYSLVTIALSKEHVDIAEFFINKDFRVYKRYKDHAEKTPLHYAVEMSLYQLICTMLNKGARDDIASIDRNNKTPLDIAILREDMKIVRLLISETNESILDDMFLYHYAVRNHNVALLKILLKTNLLPTKKNRFNETAFCVAVKEDHTDLLCLLWERYDDIIKRSSDYKTLLGLLFIAVIIDHKESVIELLEITTEFTVNTQVSACDDGWALFDYFDGFSLLHCAVRYLHLDLVNFFLDNYADPSALDATGSSPLHIALEVKESISNRNSERYRTIKKIIDKILYTTKKEYINPVNRYGISHFHVICTQNKPMLSSFYLLNGASVNDTVHEDSPIFKGFSPLHFAVKYMCRKTVKVLLDKGADIDQEADYKITPLHIASKQPSVQMVKLLIRYGANITKQDCNGNTPVHYAFRAKNYEILDVLMTVHAIINANPVNATGISHFHVACTTNDLTIVARFLRNGSSVNDCIPINSDVQCISNNDSIYGFSPLHLAASFNRVQTVQYLLEQGADVGIIDARGFTPFHVACMYTYEKFVSLIENELNGAFICEEIDEEYNPCNDSFLDVAEMETESKQYHKYDFINTGDNYDESSVVDWSSNRKDHINMINLLIRYNSDVNKIDNFGNGPLFYICYFNLKRILIMMNHTINCNKMVRMHLVKSLYEELSFRRQILLNCILGCEINKEKCYNNGSILHYICIDREYPDIGRLELMIFFLNLGANVDATNDRMQTPLHLATQMNDVRSVKILLAYNANVNCKQAENLATPLHIATNLLFSESIHIVDLLLNNRADINAKQLDGQTPLHILLSKPYNSYSELKNIFYRFCSLDADVNIADRQGKTALFVACTNVAREVVEDLLRFGADVTVEDCNGVNICQFVYNQIKSVMVAYGKMQTDLIDIFWIILKHALKLQTIKLISAKSMLQTWIDLKNLLKLSKDNNGSKELSTLVDKCLEEIVALKKTEISTNLSVYDLLVQEDHVMIRIEEIASLKAFIQADSFDETFTCYGYLLKLKYYKKIERCLLLSEAKE